MAGAPFLPLPNIIALLLLLSSPHPIESPCLYTLTMSAPAAFSDIAKAANDVRISFKMLDPADGTAEESSKLMTTDSS